MERLKFTPADMPQYRSETTQSQALNIPVQRVESQLDWAIDTTSTSHLRSIEEQAELSHRIRNALGGGDSHMFGRKPGGRGGYRYS